MTHGSLFSGIGGFDLAAEWAGFTNVFSCEKDSFCRRVLQHHWPHINHHSDVKEFPSSQYAGRIDVLSGGFPCQPYSTAGKRLGKDDDRHLWPYMLRVIRDVGPTFVVGENVRGLLNWSGGLVFDEVCSDLEGEGYEVIPFVLPAAGVGAPHRRDRVWFVAHAHGGTDVRTSGGYASSSEEERVSQRHEVRESAESGGIRYDEYATGQWSGFPSSPALCGGDDGLPSELDGVTFRKWRRESIKAYGNAIVPQVAYQIFQSLKL